MKLKENDRVNGRDICTGLPSDMLTYCLLI